MKFNKITSHHDVAAEKIAGEVPTPMDNT